MSEIDRRVALGTGAAALAATGVSARAANAMAPADTAGGGNPFLFRLTRSAPDDYHGGSLRGAHEKNFPVLTGQQASVYFVHLDVGGMREPHWHPSAWELNFIISGTADWVVLGTHADGSYHNERFRAGQGDLVFAPQGFSTTSVMRACAIRSRCS
ncbi:cupin domain-containing protein [Sciscionella marina]|uniref:cupin domain-containing protein n=1 Tax=Sciscionella marina TaxID=508770 RepID=UPI0003A8319D|nr:cupin domain-containing protein [Sciscionella marina]